MRLGFLSASDAESRRPCLRRCRVATFGIGYLLPVLEDAGGSGVRHNAAYLFEGLTLIILSF